MHKLGENAKFARIWDQMRPDFAKNVIFKPGGGPLSETLGCWQEFAQNLALAGGRSRRGFFFGKNSVFVRETCIFAQNMHFPAKIGT